ncbi:MAG: Elongation factor G [candidate division WS2 bacterium]|nr:Elongation factor G [Candidatus Lithacetigena glycinireducens]
MLINQLKLIERLPISDGNKNKMEEIRNIGVIAHIDAGKTTTTERLLFFSGKIYRLGEVDSGTTQMDYMVQERERGITITAAVTTCFWKDYKINIIDTPGHVDFTIEVERSLRVLDGAVMVLCGVAGVQTQSETVWRQADRHNIPLIVYVNKMDRTGANFDKALNSLKDKLGITAVAINIPLGEEDDFQGVIDIINMKSIVYEDDLGLSPREETIKDEHLDRALFYREKLLEKVAELKEELTIKYLEGKEITSEEINQALREATISYEIVPVLCGTSFKNKAVQPLLDAIINYLPSPLDVPTVKGINPFTQKTEERKADINEPFSALAFKVVSDTYVGRLTFIRVYSGSIKAGSYIYNVNKKEKERVSRLLKMHANRREEVMEIEAGDLGAVVGLRVTSTGDSLTEESNPILLENIQVPMAVISQAIEPKSRVDQDILALSLSKLSDEDPTFNYKVDPDTGQLVIFGMGELHLEIITDRLKREFGVGVNIGNPQVSYRETITTGSKAQGKYIKQTGGKGQYGDVSLRMEPLERGKGNEIVNAIREGAIPREFVTAVEEGIKQSLEMGTVAGYPVVDVRVIIEDGSYHAVDSSAMAFRIAGSIGFKAAMRKAAPILLEPIMFMEVIIPEEYLGNVLSHLVSSRAEVQGIEIHGITRIVSLRIPLNETFNYATILRSMTQGRGVFNLEFAQYKEAPSYVLSKISGLV